MVERADGRFVVISVCLGICVMGQAQGQLSDSRLPGESPPPYFDQWGSKGTADGEFDYAWDVDVDASGNVYVVDYGSHRIQKFDSSGTFISMWSGFLGTTARRVCGRWQYPGKSRKSGCPDGTGALRLSTTVLSFPTTTLMPLVSSPMREYIPPTRGLR